MEAQGIIREEQSVTEDIDEHEVIDARDLLEHLKRNNPVSKSSSSGARLQNDKKEEEEEKEKTKTKKWEQHAEALQQWRRETAIYKQRYQLVQQTYEEYVQKKKQEHEEYVRKKYEEYVQQCGQGSSSDGGPTGESPGASQSQMSCPCHYAAGKEAGPHVLGD